MTDTTSRQLILTVAPRLVVSDAARAIDFYVAAFGAVEQARYTLPDGKIVHADLDIGRFRIGVKDEDDDDRAPTSRGSPTVIMDLTVTDADAVGAAIVDAGGTVLDPVQDRHYGERGGRFADPFGHQWGVGHKLDGQP